MRIINLVVAVVFIFVGASTGLAKAHKKSRNPQSETWSPPVSGSFGALGYDDKTFATPEALKSEVDFWIKIYTQYTTEQGVFHYAGSTDKILGELDLSQVYAHSNWSLIRKEKESELIIARQKRLIAKKFAIKDIKKIRLQKGLKDRMREAIRISGLYLPMMEKIFRDNKLPTELTRVVFVESSFNINAGSKVGASGLWQIMPAVANKFKYISDSQDLRSHPIYSTQVAAKIFKQNYQILKSWPLAITAYNHGVGSLGKIVRKYKSNDISFLVENVSAKKSFGFASRNFYATYLAALHVERNANLYFPEPIYREGEMQISYFKLKQKISYEKFLVAFNNNEKKLKELNPHIKSKYLKRGAYLPAQVVVNLPKTSPVKLAETAELRF